MGHMCRVSTVIARLGAYLSTRMQTAQPGLEEAGITHIFFFRKVRVSGLGIETEGGMTIARDESFPRVVTGAKLAKAIAATGKYFMGKWSRSMKERINAISEKFSGLATGNQAVVVTPCVPKEDVTALHNKLQKIE